MEKLNRDRTVKAPSLLTEEDPSMPDFEETGQEDEA